MHKKKTHLIIEVGNKIVTNVEIYPFLSSFSVTKIMNQCQMVHKH